MKCINNQIFKCFHISHLAAGGMCIECAILYIQNHDRYAYIWKWCVSGARFIGFHQPDLPYLMDYSEICEFRDGHFRAQECDRHFSLGRLIFLNFFFIFVYMCLVPHIEDFGSRYTFHCLWVELTFYSIAFETEMNSFFF